MFRGRKGQSCICQMFVVIGISRRKQKGWPIILIALGIVFVIFAVYLGFPK